MVPAWMSQADRVTGQHGSGWNGSFKSTGWVDPLTLFCPFIDNKCVIYEY